MKFIKRIINYFFSKVIKVELSDIDRSSTVTINGHKFSFKNGLKNKKIFKIK